jgi:hypothetical protein
VAPDSYGILFCLVLLALVGGAALLEAGLSAGALALTGIMVIYAFWTSGVWRNRIILLTVVVLCIWVAGAVASLDDSRTTLWGGVFVAVLTGASMVAIVRRMSRELVIDAGVVLGALCLYLLIGYFFAGIFGIVAGSSDQPFFAQSGVGDGDAFDRIYYSYVTLTTTGYGDLSASGDLGRMLSATEALLGELYLVSLVALVVGNLGRVRKRARGEDE